MNLAALTPSSAPRTAYLVPLLRERTHALHVRVEQSMDVSTRFATLDSYRDLLVRLYPYYSQVENMCGSAKTSVFWNMLGMDFGKLRKAPNLECDLLHLGLSANQIVDLQRSRSPTMPDCSTIGEFIGIYYVLEGATLGGQVIGRYLERSLGFLPGDPGGCFYAGYGSKTKSSWQRYCASVEHFMFRQELFSAGTTSCITNDAVRSARRTFSDIENCIMSADAMSGNRK